MADQIAGSQEYDHLDPVVASSNRFADVGPYSSIVYHSEPRKWADILPWEFPQAASREVEEAFLRQWFDEREIHMQGGAHGAGLGFRFLKQVWYSIAMWNAHERIPAVAHWWWTNESNREIVTDKNMLNHICHPDAKPETFFDYKDIDMFGYKILTFAVKQIQTIAQHVKAQVDTRPQLDRLQIQKRVQRSNVAEIHSAGLSNGSHHHHHAPVMSIGNPAAIQAHQMHQRDTQYVPMPHHSIKTEQRVVINDARFADPPVNNVDRMHTETPYPGFSNQSHRSPAQDMWTGSMHQPLQNQADRNHWSTDDGRHPPQQPHNHSAGPQVQHFVPPTSTHRGMPFMSYGQQATFQPGSQHHVAAELLPPLADKTNRRIDPSHPAFNSVGVSKDFIAQDRTDVIELVVLFGSENVTEQGIRDLLASVHVHVAQVRISYHGNYKRSGSKYGLANVKFQNHEDARRALALNGTNFNHVNFKVEVNKRYWDHDSVSNRKSRDGLKSSMHEPVSRYPSGVNDRSDGSWRSLAGSGTLAPLPPPPSSAWMGPEQHGLPSMPFPGHLKHHHHPGLFDQAPVPHEFRQVWQTKDALYDENKQSTSESSAPTKAKKKRLKDKMKVERNRISSITEQGDHNVPSRKSTATMSLPGRQTSRNAELVQPVPDAEASPHQILVRPPSQLTNPYETVTPATADNEASTDVPISAGRENECHPELSQLPVEPDSGAEVHGEPSYAGPAASTVKSPSVRHSSTTSVNLPPTQLVVGSDANGQSSQEAICDDVATMPETTASKVVGRIDTTTQQMTEATNHTADTADEVTLHDQDSNDIVTSAELADAGVLVQATISHDTGYLADETSQMVTARTTTSSGNSTLQKVTDAFAIPVEAAVVSASSLTEEASQVPLPSSPLTPRPPATKPTPNPSKQEKPKGPSQTESLSMFGRRAEKNRKKDKTKGSIKMKAKELQTAHRVVSAPEPAALTPKSDALHKQIDMSAKSKGKKRSQTESVTNIAEQKSNKNGHESIEKKGKGGSLSTLFGLLGTAAPPPIAEYHKACSSSLTAPVTATNADDFQMPNTALQMPSMMASDMIAVTTPQSSVKMNSKRSHLRKAVDRPPLASSRSQSSVIQIAGPRELLVAKPSQVSSLQKVVESEQQLVHGTCQDENTLQSVPITLGTTLIVEASSPTDSSRTLSAGSMGSPEPAPSTPLRGLAEKLQLGTKKHLIEAPRPRNAHKKRAQQQTITARDEALTMQDQLSGLVDKLKGDIYISATEANNSRIVLTSTRAAVARHVEKTSREEDNGSGDHADQSTLYIVMDVENDPDAAVRPSGTSEESAFRPHEHLITWVPYESPAMEPRDEYADHLIEELDIEDDGVNDNH